MDDSATRFLQVTDDLLILATQIAALVKRIESVASVASRPRKRELRSMAKRLVDRLTNATEIAETDIEYEFETLYQRLVASLDGLREAVAHGNRVIEGLN
jgi:hypothetical protein